MPRFTTENVEQAFDKIFAELYPGEAVDENDEDAVPTRAPPYEFGGWREKGITTTMCAEFCNRHTIALRVLYKSAIIYKNDVDNRHGNAPTMIYSIWGDHAFFYRDTKGAQTVKMAPVSAIPEAKLACRVDYERAPYALSLIHI